MISQRFRNSRNPIVARVRRRQSESDSHSACHPDLTGATVAEVKRPVVVDLFAGVGGLALGFEQAGCDVIAAVEFDKTHGPIHRRNFPRTELLEEDVSKVEAADIRAAACRGAAAHGRPGPWDGVIDILIGGPPCQGFSTGGRHTRGDRRNALLSSFARLLGELRPRYFVVENVPGLMSRKHRHTLDRFKARARQAGYGILSPVRALDAADFGVPQIRRRVIIVGWLEGERGVQYPTVTVVRHGSLSAENIERGPTVDDAIRDLPSPGEEETTSRKSRTDLETGLVVSVSKYVAALNDFSITRMSYPRLHEDAGLSGMSATQHSADSVKRFAATLPGRSDRISRFRRLESRGLCKTLRAGTGPDHGSHTPPRPLHPSENRVISVREAARLHSFPDWFSFHETKWHAWREIGNSVPPLFARAIATEVLKACLFVPNPPALQ